MRLKDLFAALRPRPTPPPLPPVDLAVEISVLTAESIRADLINFSPALMQKALMSKPELLTSIAAVAAWGEAKESGNTARLIETGNAMARVLNASTKSKAVKAIPASTFTKDLKAAIALLSTAIEPQTTIPILTAVLLEAKGDRLRLHGTDLDREIVVEVSAPGIGDWTLAVGFRDFKAAIGSTKSSVTLTPSTDENKLNVNVGGIDAVVSGFKASDFPRMEELTFEHWATMPSPVLSSILQFITPAISTEETRYYLNGSYFQLLDLPDGRKFRAVATDGHRLMLDEASASDSASTPSAMIVPRLALKSLQAGFKFDDAVAIEVRYGFNKETGEKSDVITHARFRLGAAATITTKIIDGTYPDYGRVLPADGKNDKLFTFNRAMLAEAVAGVTRIIREKTKSVKFTLGTDEVALFCRNMDGGKAEKTVPVEYAGTRLTPFEIGFNGKYLAEALAANGSAHTVVMAMHDPASPTVMVDAAQPQRITILMPLRV